MLAPPTNQEVHINALLDYERRRVERENQKPGHLTGIDCPICRNRGIVWVLDEKHITPIMKRCECMDRRAAESRIKKSGLTDALQGLTFQTYAAREKWQLDIKKAAIEYTRAPEGWFFIGGQVGCGKTHICTAILNELLKNKACVYMKWRDDVRDIKSKANDEAGSRLLERFKSAPVLYIDDLFKGGITEADLNIAFEIINARYNSRTLLTIISTEKYINELIDLDEGIGSRIAQRSHGYQLEIGRDDRKNVRLRI